LIVCPKCQFEMFVTPKAVVSNWQFNAAVWAGLAMWIGFASIIFTNPETAATIGRYFQLSARTFENRLVLVFAGVIPAVIVALPFALIGRIIGISVAARLNVDAAEEAAVAEFRRQLTPVAQKKLRRRSLFVRACFGLVWAVAFSVVAALALGLWAVREAGDDPDLRQQALRQAGETFGPWALLGSLALAVVLGGCGLLPGTRRTKRRESPAAADRKPTKPSSRRVRWVE
jgi:hypothetical protein